MIERIYGLVQNYFQTQRGYVGRNPLTDRYELVQKQIALVKAGHEHPSKFFESKAQWMEILREVFLKFNDTPMGGKYHTGRSPKQVFEDCYGPDKLMSVPEDYRYLLASNKIISTVGRNGISFKFGNRQFNYKNYETGRLRGQRVIAWFNPERPTTLCCTDLDGKKPFVVPLETSVFNHDPEDGTLRKARSENDAHNSYQKELHSSLKPYYKSEFFQNLFRPTVVSPRTIETASEFKRQEQVIEVR